ncbi:MAG: hypothetical protein WD904_03570 [Dehalococcoidia bacterium]
MSEAETGTDQPAAFSIPFVIERSRVTVIGWCVVLAILVFSVYWFLGPQSTAYSYQVQQANNIIHGHLDLVPEYTPTLGVLERVLYDGEGFCLPQGESRGVEEIENPRFSPNCKTYMQHSLGPAFMVVPGVLVWGVELNQTLVSVVIAAMTAPLVFLISRYMSTKLVNQLALTAMMMFGTILWWVGANGGVWMFAHTTSLFFIFGAIYFTVGRQNPFLAAACLGAAFLCRPTMILTGLFFVIMFSPLWLRPAAPGLSLWQRINPEPVWMFGSGILPFFFVEMLVNYLRFDDPLETGYGYTEQTRQTHLQASVYQKGLFDISYVERHPPVVLEQTPVFQKNGPYIMPSWFGMAMWITTPALLLAYFPNIKTDRRIWIPAACALAITATIILSRGISRAWDDGWATTDIPFGIHLLPFWALTALAIVWAVRQQDRLVLACWAAIIPTAFFLFTFAATGWAQFGYRYGLDFTPFLWLLAARQIGDQQKWYHIALIAAGIAVNMMGVLWIYQFEPHHTNGWSWVVF